MTDDRFPIDLADPSRGPTAAQAAGLTLKAATTLMKAAKATARQLGVSISVAVCVTRTSTSLP